IAWSRWCWPGSPSCHRSNRDRNNHREAFGGQASCVPRHRGRTRAFPLSMIRTASGSTVRSLNSLGCRARRWLLERRLLRWLTVIGRPTIVPRSMVRRRRITRLIRFFSAVTFAALAGVALAAVRAIEVSHRAASEAARVDLVALEDAH